MKRIQTGDPEQMACEEAPGLEAVYFGALALIGFALPLFLLARGGAERIVGTGESVVDAWPEIAGATALGLAWLIFTLRAVRRAFRRVAFVIDRRAQTIRTRSWWPFPPGHAKPLASFNLVVVGEISIPGPLASSTPTRQTIVSLADPRAGEPLRIAIGDASPMRTLAEDIARFTGLDMLDTTVGEPAVTPAADVGQPLPPVANASGEPRKLRPLPPQSKLVTAPSGSGLRIEIPNGNAGCFGILVCSVLGIVGVIAYAAFHAVSLNQWLAYPIFGGVAVLVLLIAGSGSRPVRTILEASIEGLRIIRRGPFGSKSIALGPDAIRGFETEGLAFTIRWESGHWVAMGLTQDEKAWIAGALGEALRAPVVLGGNAGT